MFCKNCGKPIESGKQFCKNCGQEFKVGKFFRLTQWFKNHRKGILIVLGVIIFFVIVSIFSEDNSSPTTPTTIPNVPVVQPSPKHILTQKEIASSVVNLVCFNEAGTITTGGSGTIFTAEGDILTNHHVIAGTDACLVALPEPESGTPNEIYVASPIIVPLLSEEYDLASVRIVGAFIDDKGISYGTFPNKFKNYDDSSFCSNYIPKLGEEIKIYGYPVTSGGYNLTITEGVISSFSDDGLILTSAKVDSGNSGGLAANQNGCFVGVPSAVKTGVYQNLGVIIPPTIILEFINKATSQ